MKKNDLYIEFLDKVSKSPMKWEEIEKEFPNVKSVLWQEIRDHNLLTQNTDGKYHLSFNSRFLLLEHQELIEARKSSRNAMYVAIASIIISIITNILNLIYC